MRHEGKSLSSDLSDSDNNDDDDDENGAKDNICYDTNTGDGNGGDDSNGARGGSAEGMHFLIPSALLELLGAMAKAIASSSTKSGKNPKLGKS